jgi:hypothetical protein
MRRLSAGDGDGWALAWRGPSRFRGGGPRKVVCDASCLISVLAMEVGSGDCVTVGDAAGGRGNLHDRDWRWPEDPLMPLPPDGDLLCLWCWGLLRWQVLVSKVSLEDLWLVVVPSSIGGGRLAAWGAACVLE